MEFARSFALTFTTKKAWSVIEAANDLEDAESCSMMEDCIKKGVSPEQLGSSGLSLLHKACRIGNVEMVKLLLSYCENPDHTTATTGQTPLHEAVTAGHVPVVEYLLVNPLKKTCSPNVLNFQNATPLQIALKNSFENSAVLLIENGADPNIVSHDDRSPLYLAVWYRLFRLIPLLLEAGANTQLSNKHGWSPLHMASRHGDVSVVQMLLDNGANVLAESNDKWLPLHQAARKGTNAVVEILVKKGGAVNAQAKGGATPLAIACAEGHPLVAQTLLKNGANPNLANHEGLTPLHWASRIDLIRLLLSNGADPTKKDSHGKTPYAFAKSDGEAPESVLKLLKDSMIFFGEKKRRPNGSAPWGVKKGERMKSAKNTSHVVSVSRRSLPRSPSAEPSSEPNTSSPTAPLAIPSSLPSSSEIPPSPLSCSPISASPLPPFSDLTAASLGKPKSSLLGDSILSSSPASLSSSHDPFSFAFLPTLPPLSSQKIEEFSKEELSTRLQHRLAEKEQLEAALLISQEETELLKKLLEQNE